MALVVELRLFSGRTNPRFVLSPDDERELRRLIGRCASAGDARQQPPRLGRRELVVYAMAPGGAWQPWFSVADGMATPVVGPGAGTSRPAPALEALLVDAAAHADLTPPHEGRTPTNREG